jgi:small basic protein
VIPALALVAGVVLGLVLEPTVPAALQPYLPIAVVAALDAVFGAVRAQLEGIFDDKVFVVSFVSNVLVAALVVFLGDQLGVGGQLSTGRGRRPRHRISATPQPSDAGSSRHEPARVTRSWGRLLTPRLRRVDVAVAVLLGPAGFAAVVQVRSTQEDGPLAAARQEDLVQILDDLDNRNDPPARRGSPRWSRRSAS